MFFHHPRKLEVRFADEAGVREQVRTAIRSALLDEGLLRSSAPRGKSAPEQTEVTPAGDQSPDAGDDDAGSHPGGETDADSTDARVPDARSPGGTDAGSTSGNPQSSSSDAGSSSSDAGSSSSDAGSADTGGGERSRRDPHVGRKFAGDYSQARLGGDGTDGAGGGVDGDTFDSLPAMEILGQFDGTYVVAATDDGLVLIDQHAADERVNYERLREQFSGEVTTQALAEPVELSLTAREAELFESHREALASLGFRAGRVDERTVEVRTVPSLVGDVADPALLRDVLGAFVTDRDPAETVEAAADELLADLACYPSVTGNTSLAEGSIRELLAALDGCENPWACPHGRPVVVEFDADEIEARFERDYPGHGGRRG